MRTIRSSDIFGELKVMETGARLGEGNGAFVLLGRGEDLEGAPFEGLFVKRYVGAIVDARTGEIVWPVEDE